MVKIEVVLNILDRMYKWISQLNPGWHQEKMWTKDRRELSINGIKT